MGACPVHCNMFRSIRGLYLLGASSILSSGDKCPLECVCVVCMEGSLSSPAPFENHYSMVLPSPQHSEILCILSQRLVTTVNAKTWELHKLTEWAEHWICFKLLKGNQTRIYLKITMKFYFSSPVKEWQ